jgi:hypothetical protein
MRFTRAAPAETTSKRTPPTSRAVAPLIGANKTSTAWRDEGRFAVDRFTDLALRAVFGGLDFFFALFAMRTL